MECLILPEGSMWKRSEQYEINELRKQMSVHSYIGMSEPIHMNEPSFV